MNKIAIGIITMLTLVACADGITDGDLRTDDTDVINVGGLAQDELAIDVENSRAVTTTDAEELPWLREPLFNGFDIGYYRGNDKKNMKFAKLRLERDGDTYKKSESGLAVYSFMEMTGNVETGNKAKWVGNGVHHFQGHYVPQSMQNTTPDAGAPHNLDNDQSSDAEDGNYTLLRHYLSMPTNHAISATVGRIKLPFYHRLCRVNAFILINPEMGSDVKLKGYDISSGKDDPTTTQLRFGNVKVLRHVEYEKVDGIEKFTPHWETVRNIIPHFEGEFGSFDKESNNLDENFILFESTEDKTVVYPSNTELWRQLKTAYEAAMAKYYADKGIDAATATDKQKNAAKEYATAATKYSMTNYGKVPVYNVIVRPTYTAPEMVMYDEQEGIDDTETNSITFTLTLNNGLEYEKVFTFDLDANRQTTVYLRIDRESIDYNSSGSELWTKNDYEDGYYGVNNENGNRLSLAGGSWQRAYRNSKGYGPSDITDGSDYNEDGKEDHITGEDGQYLSDEKWIERFAQATKDGAYHGDYFILDKDITITATKLPVDFVFTGHLDARGYTITLTDCGTTVTDVAEWWEDNYETATDYSGSDYYVSDGAGNYSKYAMPDNIYKKTKDAVPAEYEQITTISEMMSYEGQLYAKTAEDTYVEYTKPSLYVNNKIHHPAETHISPSHLFAGLNGVYTTKQESHPDLPAEQWEANVHKEGGYWVPVSGYRAEVLNTKVEGAPLFKAGFTTGTDGDVSGYVQNCSDVSGKVPNYSNGIPQY